MKEILKAHNFRFNKKFGQNFLTDNKIPMAIAEQCTEYISDDLNLSHCNENPCEKIPYGILEIGPGAGILTKQLAKRYQKVLAVEIDSTLIPILQEVLAKETNVEIINADILETDISLLAQKLRDSLSVNRKSNIGETADKESADGETDSDIGKTDDKETADREPTANQGAADEKNSLPKIAVCANLPYYITTPIIMHLLESGVFFSYITVMVQKEVALRLVSKAGDADYGAITAAISLYGNAKKLFDVSPGHFFPKPAVDSTVIRITPHNPPKYTAQQTQSASKLIKSAFGMRRKTLVNALFPLNLTADKQTLADIISKTLDCPADIRGERLSADDFVKLSEKLGV